MIILDLPFDESQNSPIAYDYSGNNTHAAVTNATFGSGHDGFSIKFKGDGYARPNNVAIDLTGDFTISFWLKNKVVAPYDTPDSIAFQFAFDPSTIVTKTIDFVEDVWQHIVWARSGQNAFIYVDGALKQTMTFTGNPIEFAIKQMYFGGAGFPYTFPLTFGANQPPYMMGDMDQLLIFNEALTPSQITINETNFFYKIDGIPFLDYDVYVSESFGLVDALETKEGTSVDWANEHGIVIDLKRIRFKPREIKLKCWMRVESGYLDFVLKANAFIEKFIPPGLHRLKVEINKHKPLEYEIYMAEGTDINKKWNANDFVGTFELILSEPQPVKRVVRFSGGTSKVKIKGKGLYNFYWGDGTSTLDINADSSVLVEHTPVIGGIYFCVITGDIDGITEFNISQNGQITWMRL